MNTANKIKKGTKIKKYKPVPNLSTEDKLFKERMARMEEIAKETLDAAMYKDGWIAIRREILAILELWWFDETADVFRKLIEKTNDKIKKKYGFFGDKSDEEKLETLTRGLAKAKAKQI